MNVADTKRAKKARDQERRHKAYQAAAEYAQIVDQAKHGYEYVHQLPEGTSSIQQAENSGLGILGWATYAEGLNDVEQLDERPNPSGKITIKAKLAD